MEFIVEFILELLFEGGEELCKSRKISKWIRYPIIVLFCLIYAGVVFLIFFASWVFRHENVLGSILFAALGVFFVVGLAWKIRKEYLKYHA